MYSKEIFEQLNGNQLDELIKKVYCTEDVDRLKKRFYDLLEKTVEVYGDGDYMLISASGRSEIGGNHTDHQHGKVIAAAVNMDNVVFVKKEDNLSVIYRTLGYGENKLDLSNLDVCEKEKFKTEALIRGIAARFVQLGYKIGGFKGLGHSEVLMGSGISSSASFEVLIAQVFNQLYNNGEISDIELAQIAQYAENHYFGKPCGLLDQMAISVGGFVTIDFIDPAHPKVEKLDFDFGDYGYHLVLVNTKGDHADLSHDYAAIPTEIKQVAQFFGKDFLSEVDLAELMENLPALRKHVANDRALTRAIHVLTENKRVDEQLKALAAKDIDSLLYWMKESGNSSYKFLQNVLVCGQYKTQNLGLALQVSETVLGKNGISRVHGGGFEGTIQAIVKDELLEKYLHAMHQLFGDDSTFVIAVRPVGGYLLLA